MPVEEGADPTEADPRPEAVRASASSLERAGTDGDDAVGTQAAGPRALAEQVKGSHAATEAVVRPSGWGTNSARSVPSVAEALERSDLPRARVFHIFGMFVDLATRLRGEPRMPSDELVVLLDQVARGLEVARLAGVVHRDLKPHNLFLHEGRVWKILDFGVAKVLDSEGTLTGDGIVGTPQYMAPEQASGGHVTHLADVYALGAIAYRCLTGRSPFKGKDLAELVYQVVHTPPMRPGLFVRVPTAIEDVLAIAMAKDPRRRFPSAQSFAHAFVAARRGKPLGIEPPSNAWT